MSNPHWAKSIDAIMLCLKHPSIDNKVTETVILHELEKAYAKGFADADRNPRQSESMGR